MKCPKCGYNSFEYNDTCPKCLNNLTGYKATYGLKAMALPLTARTELARSMAAASTINALASTAKAKSYSWKILPREADETPDESRGTAYTRPDGVRNASPPGEIVYYGHKDNPATTRDEREDPYTLFGDDSKKFGLGTGTGCGPALGPVCSSHFSMRRGSGCFSSGNG